jgi:hypothetical protein
MLLPGNKLYGPDGKIWDSSDEYLDKTAANRIGGFAGEGYGREFPLPHPSTFIAILQSGSRTFWHSGYDEALRYTRESALVMKRDAFLISLLNERKLAVATIPWELEIPDEKDQRQVKVRDALKNGIESISDLRGIIWALLDAIWYGRQGVEIEWDWTTVRGAKVMVPVWWMPISGDKIGYDFDSRAYVLVNAMVVHQKRGVEIVNTTAGARGLLLKGTWRDHFVIHHHERRDGDFFEPETAGAAYGVGIRSDIFWMDWIRRNYLEWITTFLERVGLGVTLWYYEGSNPAAFQAVQQAAQNQSRRANLFIPVFTDGKGSPKGLVERLEVPVNGVDALRLLKEDIEQKIERYIVGQEASSKSAGSKGLGNEAGAEFQMACVPVETSEILTRHGWKHGADAIIGEEVLAYDHENDYCEWTPLLDKSFYPDGNLVRIYNERGRFDAFCTPEHSWAVEKNARSRVSPVGNPDARTGLRGAKFTPGRRLLKKTCDFTKNDNILLAAMEVSTVDSILTPTEAAILGWAVTDGTIRWSERRRDGKSALIRICQSKERNFESIRQLVRAVNEGFTETIMKPTRRTFPSGKTYDCKPQHWWSLPTYASTDLLAKCGFVSRHDLPRIVCHLNREARAAMLEAMMLAEGESRFNQFGNTDTAIVEAFEILCALQGLATGRTRIVETTHKPSMLKIIKKVRWAQGDYLIFEDAGRAEVWCPTTKYGTWVMRQHGRVMITGNTKQSITDFDSHNLAENITGNARRPGLIYLMQRFSFPDTTPDKPDGFRVKFKFRDKAEDPKKKLEALKTLVELGVPTKADDLRKAAGTEKPDPGDELVQAPQPAAGGLPGEGLPGTAGDVPEEAGPQGPEPAGEFEPPYKQDDETPEQIMQTRRNGKPAQYAGVHKFSSTQFNFMSGPLGQKIIAMANKIADEDLAEDGREKEPHVTVKYGLHTADAAKVRDVVSGFRPLTIRFGRSSLFPPKEGGVYVVVKVDIDSKELRLLNRLLGNCLECTDTHPTYKPHITLAYVKPGKGQKYVGMKDLEGTEAQLRYLVFSSKDGQITNIDLQQEPIAFQYASTPQLAANLGTGGARQKSAATLSVQKPAAPGWIVHHGTQGGVGWKNIQTGEVVYASSGRGPPGSRPGATPATHKQASSSEQTAQRRRMGAMALARWYADAWNVLAELGMTPTNREKHEAGLELYGTGVSLWKNKAGQWHVKQLGKDHERKPGQYAFDPNQPRAPAGTEEGGEWVPKEFAGEATPARQEGVRQAHTAAAEERKERGPVDVDKLKKQINATTSKIRKIYAPPPVGTKLLGAAANAIVGMTDEEVAKEFGQETAKEITDYLSKNEVIAKDNNGVWQEHENGNLPGFTERENAVGEVEKILKNDGATDKYALMKAMEKHVSPVLSEHILNELLDDEILVDLGDGDYDLAPEEGQDQYARHQRQYAFDPNQPRAPEGTPEGGEWVSEGTSLSGSDLRHARQTYKALMRHHGELLMHRVDELTQDAAKVLEAIPDDEEHASIREKFKERMAAYGHMLDWAKEHGMTPEKAPDVSQEQPKTTTAKPKLSKEERTRQKVAKADEAARKSAIVFKGGEPVAGAQAASEENVSRVKKALLQLDPVQAGGSGRVRIADLRKQLGNMSPAEFEAALRDLSRKNYLTMYPQDDPRQIRPDDEAAAVHSSTGVPQHIIRFGGSGAPSLAEQMHESYKASRPPDVSALVKQHGGSANLADIAAIRASMKGLSREQQDKAITEAIKSGKVTVAAYEGRGGLSKEQQEAALHLPGGDRVGYLMLRQYGREVPVTHLPPSGPTPGVE